MATPNGSKKRASKKLRHVDEYDSFVTWIGLPKELRSPKTQRELAKDFGVGEDTLSEWKQRPAFWEDVAKRRKSWGRERTPDVLMSLYKRIEKTGSAPEIRLWMEIMEDWQAKLITVPDPYAHLREMSDEELMANIRELQTFFRKR